MNYYALIYETVGDYVARRAQFREQHLLVARAWRERGELVLGGAFDDPVDRALLVFRVDHTTEAQLPKYLEHFSKNVLPELRYVNGFLGVTVSVHHGANEAEIFVETIWRSLEAIRGFAGTDVEAAVIPPEAAALLTSFDRRVRHCEIAVSAGA